MGKTFPNLMFKDTVPN